MEIKNILCKLRENQALVLFLCVFLLTISFLLVQSLLQNDGHLIYRLDDAYIHMAMAKNISKHGVFGITNDEFSSTSSSILYTLLLALLFLIFGVNEIIPFIINIIFSITIIWFFYYMIKKKTKMSNLRIFMILFFISFTLPLPMLIFDGLEHPLHILVTIIIIWIITDLLSSNEESVKPPLNRKRMILLMVLLFVAPLIRFESLFIVLSISLLFFLKRMYLISISMGLIGLLPVLLYGIISIKFGWFFLPNSIMLKGNIPYLGDQYIMFQGVWRLVNESSHLLLILIAASLIQFKNFTRKSPWKDNSVISIVFIIASVLHLQFASTKVISRYDGYLLAIGFYMIIISINKFFSFGNSFGSIRSQIRELKKNLNKDWILMKTSLVITLFFISSPFLYRGLYELWINSQATNNIYDQQYQMAKFLDKFYKGKCVALNDIGAANFYNDIKCLDLWGLANKEVASAILEGIYDKEIIDHLTKKYNCSIAIIYDLWFSDFGIPSHWFLAGQWRILDNFVCGGDTVSFYAVSSEEIVSLIQNLKEFSSELPLDVIELGNYTSL